MTTRNELPAAGAFLLERFPRGGRVLCAVSGGLDSMCLLHYLDTWGRAHGFAPAAAHFHHQLRKAADADQRFVEDWCAARHIPCFTGSGDTRALADAEGLSAEEAARKLRYGFLEETARREGFDAILTAHHADDNAETMLLNLVRGTGLRGLAGIPRQRDGILRPFLEISREDLAAYAAAHHLPHVEDETNTDPDAAARNLVRLQVMPLLRRLNPRAAEHMARTAARLAEMDTGLSDLTERYLRAVRVQPDRVTISLANLAEVPEFLRPQVLLGLFDMLEVGRKDIGAVHLEALERLKNCPLCWGDYTLTLLDHREGPGLALQPGPEWEHVSVAPCDPGARLTLPGERGGRTVKRLCLDRHISLSERDRLPALYLGDRLAAVWGLGVDTEFAPEGTPCRFIQIKKKTEENHHEK